MRRILPPHGDLLNAGFSAVEGVPNVKWWVTRQNTIQEDSYSVPLAASTPVQ